jgi:hypothetical protein
MDHTRWSDCSPAFLGMEYSRRRRERSHRYWPAATDAHELAGYKRSDSNASTLARTEEIRGRAEEINRETLE